MLLPKHLSMTRLLAYLLVQWRLEQHYHCIVRAAALKTTIHHHCDPSHHQVTAHDAGQTTTITLITAILAPVLPHLGWLLCSIVHHAAITLRRPDVPAALIANLLPAHPSPTQPSSALLSTLTASLLKASRHPEAVARTLDAASHLDDVDVQHLVGAVLPALVQCLANTRTAAHVAAVSIHLLQLGNEQALTTMVGRRYIKNVV